VDRAPSLGRRTGPARHEWPEVDEAALVAARQADHVLAAARSQGSRRWEEFFARLPDQLRDDPPNQLRASALRARAAFGPKDSVRDALSPEVTEPLLEAIDRLLKAIAKREAARE
jgi:hypothetical protein